MSAGPVVFLFFAFLAADKHFVGGQSFPSDEQCKAFAETIRAEDKKSSEPKIEYHVCVPFSGKIEGVSQAPMLPPPSAMPPVPVPDDDGGIEPYYVQPQLPIRPYFGQYAPLVEGLLRRYGNGNYYGGGDNYNNYQNYYGGGYRGYRGYGGYRGYRPPYVQHHNYGNVYRQPHVQHYSGSRSFGGYRGGYSGGGRGGRGGGSGVLGRGGHR